MKRQQAELTLAGLDVALVMGMTPELIERKGRFGIAFRRISLNAWERVLISPAFMTRTRLANWMAAHEYVVYFRNGRQSFELYFLADSIDEAQRQARPFCPEHDGWIYSATLRRESDRPRRWRFLRKEKTRPVDRRRRRVDRHHSRAMHGALHHG